MNKVNILIDVDLKKKIFKLKISDKENRLINNISTNYLEEDYTFLKNNYYRVNCKCFNTKSENMYKYSITNDICYHQILFILKMETKYLNS